MNLTDPQKVQSLITAGDEVRRIRSENRARINCMANGFPPMEDADAEAAHINVNVNWGEMADLLLYARRQYESAMFGRSTFFNIAMPLAPLRMRDAWGERATSFINKHLKESKDVFETTNGTIASVVAHGVGPEIWRDSWKVLPDEIALEDLAVPTDTKVKLSNLDWFAERVNYTEAELGMKVFGPNSSNCWNKRAVAHIISQYRDDNNQDAPQYDWWTQPEKMYELMKQNLYLFTSDAVPIIPMWHFYHRDECQGNTCWKLKVVPDMQTKGADEGADEFLYDSGDKPFAQKREHILHIQFGDLCNKNPQLIYSVRSLGFMLMEPCFWSNTFRCRLFQHAMENMNPWWKVSDPSGGRGRAQRIEMFYNGVIPDGVMPVAENERHQINGDLIDRVMAQSRQLMQEKSSAYTQSVDNGTQKEQTAFETRVKLEQVNAATTSLLTRWFFYESLKSREICRRLCLRRSPDTFAQDFQEAMKKARIPTQFLNAADWDITVTLPAGSGNPTLAQAQSQQLMELRPALPPKSQMKVLHSRVLAVTSDPQVANDLVPLGGVQDVTDGQRDAEQAFGTLMQGVPVNFKDSDAPQDIVTTLLSLLAQKVKIATQSGNTSTMEDLAGMANVGKTIQGYIARMDADPALKAEVSGYKKGLMSLMNLLKGFAQRLQKQQQAAQQQSGQNGNGNGHEDAVKLASTIAQAKVKNKMTEEKAQQQRQHKNVAFFQEQQRKNIETAAQIRRDDVKAKSQNRMKAFDKGGE